MWLKAFLMTLLFLVTNPCLAQSNAKKTNIDWQKRTDLRDRGLRECESFRQGLLVAETKATTRGELVAAAIERFPELCRAPLRGRPDLEGFRVSSRDFVRQIPEAFG